MEQLEQIPEIPEEEKIEELNFMKMMFKKVIRNAIRIYGKDHSRIKKL